MGIQIVNHLIHEGNVYSGDGAVFSRDRRHRYLLTRRLGFQFTTCLFIMLNPSTADATKSDPTVTRCINYVRHWGFGRLEVCNIFAYRATDPRELYGLSEYVPECYNVANGPENDVHIRAAIDRSDRVVCAWGNHGRLFKRGAEVHEMIIEAGKIPFVFKFTKELQPVHPLYQKKAQPLVSWMSRGR